MKYVLYVLFMVVLYALVAFAACFTGRIGWELGGSAIKIGADAYGAKIKKGDRVHGRAAA